MALDGATAHSAAEAPVRLTRHQHGLAPCVTCHIWHCQACGCARVLAVTSVPLRL
jgi:hypothetical protein